MQTSSNQSQSCPPAVDHTPGRRIPGLDGLRALAVIAVVWHHAHPGYPGLPLSQNGFLGVDMFFVLSGFLITTLLLQEQRTTGTVSLIGFYIRRSLRIFPLYYAVLLLMAVFFSVSNKSANATVFMQELPWHAAYLSNWVSLKSMMAIAWSLSTEEQFYLVWPPLFAWLGTRAVWPLLAFLAVNQGVNFGVFDDFLNRSGMAVQSLPLLQITFTPILLGVLLAFGMKTSVVQRFESKVPIWALPVMVIVSLLIANTSGDIRGWPRLMFHISTTALIALLITSPKSFVVKLLEWRPLTHIGTVSYGVYLFHMLVLYVIYRVADVSMLRFPTIMFLLAMLVCVAVASFSYRFFELPIMSLKNRIVAFVSTSFVRVKLPRENPPFNS